LISIQKAGIILKKVKSVTVCHHQGDGKQPKTFGLNFLILKFLTF